VSAANVATLPFGAEMCADGRWRFRLWAPSAVTVTLLLRSGANRAPPEVAMQREEAGWFGTHAHADAGDSYFFRIDGRIEVPDPAARANDDVHGASRLVDPHAYVWRNRDWRGRPWHEAVIYELHVGTFTPGGTFRAALDRLDHLAALGVTFVELMPVAEFAGARGWGYDGVLWFAPESAYGTPDDLKAFVDAAHARGLGVLLDVVYNHFGPEGNWLHVYVPEFFNPQHHTPWGAAINYDGDASRAVREFVIRNALYWLEEFRFDGLRLDAVHTIRDDSSPHLLIELARRVRTGPGRERHVHLVLENVYNEATLLGASGDPERYDAQWNDDFHHCMHTLLTGEAEGHYVDFVGRAHELLRRCLAEGFSFQGEPSRYRAGRTRGEPSGHLPPTAFVCFLQNHDSVGNRAQGDRLSSIVRDTSALRAAVAILLLAPAPPLLFMGEEWCAPEPFPFFCDFGPELARQVREGRQRELETRFQRGAALPDPNDPATFRAATLDWTRLDEAPHADWLEYYRALLGIRAREIVPRVPLVSTASAGGDGPLLLVRWRLSGGATLALDANLSSAPVRAPPSGSGRVLFATSRAAALRGAEDALPPWSVSWRLEPDDAGSPLIDRPPP
jgi:malto-oligosyltrehalose trehalohydrolase